MYTNQISIGNTSDAQTLTSTLGGTWYGNYGRTRCPVCGGNKQNPPLSIKRGEKGLLLHCFKGCDFRDIREALSVYGFNERKPMSDADALRERKNEDAIAQKKATQAEKCWDESRPISETPAEAYLRGRGITGDLPDTLRFHPDCWHAGIAKKLPAMVARIDGGEQFAIHRTYLNREGRKADVEPAKMMLGGVKGGAVRLRENTGPLVIGEGIESALSAFILHGDLTATAWAALSTSGLRGLRLPRLGQFGKLGSDQPSLIIAVDGEMAGRDAGRDLAERAAGLGWKVGILDPGDGADWNDRLIGVGARHEYV